MGKPLNPPAYKGSSSRIAWSRSASPSASAALAAVPVRSSISAASPSMTLRRKLYPLIQQPRAPRSASFARSRSRRRFISASCSRIVLHCSRTYPSTCKYTIAHHHLQGGIVAESTERESAAQTTRSNSPQQQMQQIYLPQQYDYCASLVLPLSCSLSAAVIFPAHPPNRELFDLRRIHSLLVDTASTSAPSSPTSASKSPAAAMRRKPPAQFTHLVKPAGLTACIQPYSGYRRLLARRQRHRRLREHHLRAFVVVRNRLAILFNQLTTGKTSPQTAADLKSSP